MPLNAIRKFTHNAYSIHKYCHVPNTLVSFFKNARDFFSSSLFFYPRGFFFLNSS